MLRPRDLLFFLLVLALGVACAVGPSPGSAGEERPLAEPQRGGMLVFAGGNPNPVTHPFKGGETDTMRVVGTVYDRLLSYKTEPSKDYRVDFEVIPWLAESWEQPDPSTYRFALRKGVTWHDGREFTAPDVVATYQWILDPENAAAIKRALVSLASVEALDAHTLLMATKGPAPFFLQDLADRNLYVVPQHLLEQPDEIKRVAIGTGAFQLRSHEPSRESSYVRNERYRESGKPHIDGYRVVWGLDRSASIAAFVAGQNDLLQLPDRKQFESVLNARPDTQAVTAPSDYGTALVLNLKAGPLGDIRVRRALQLALDRRAMVKSITFGDGMVNSVAVPAWKEGWAIPHEELLTLPGFREDKAADVRDAKRLLGEAGYPNGFTLRLLYQQDVTTPPPVAEATAAQLKAIGVDVVLEPRDAATFNKLERDGAFEMQVGVTHKANLRGRFRDRLHSKGLQNVTEVSDAQLDQSLDMMISAMDVVARKRAALEVQRRVLDQGYILPTIEFPTYGLWQPWVKEYFAQPEVVVFFDQLNAPRLWLDQALMPAERRS